MALDSFTQIIPRGDIPTARALHQSVVFNNHLYIVMGQGAEGNYGDLLSTKDGVVWNRRTSLVDTDGNTIVARHSFGLCKHDNKVYLIGGYYSGSAPIAQVYVTSDMVHWTRLKGSNLTSRSGFCTYSFNQRLWAIGGSDAASPTNNVWWSKNGISWTQENNAPWAARTYATGVVYNNSIYIMGGVGAARYNDVWYTKDGRHWTRIEPAANWSARGGMVVESMGSKLVLVGGQTGVGTYSGELYHSKIGNNWKLGDNQVPMAANIRNQSMNYFNNRLFSFGGVTGASTYSIGIWKSKGNLFKSA